MNWNKFIIAAFIIGLLGACKASFEITEKDGFGYPMEVIMVYRTPKQAERVVKRKELENQVIIKADTLLMDYEVFEAYFK